MMKKILIALSLAALAGSPALAEQCRKGTQFAKCGTPGAVPWKSAAAAKPAVAAKTTTTVKTTAVKTAKVQRCRDIKTGRAAKCGTPGTKPF